MADGSALNIEEIQRALPHRFPFLLVDRVTRIDRTNHPSGNRVGWKIWAIKNVSVNEPYFPGHFPHRPVMPGVLQIECMAQTAALSVISPDGPEMDVLIAGINEARFRKPVTPGDQCVISAEIIRDRGQIFVIQCAIHVDGELASEAEMIAKVFPKVVEKAKLTQQGTP